MMINALGYLELLYCTLLYVHSTRNMKFDWCQTGVTKTFVKFRFKISAKNNTE